MKKVTKRISLFLGLLCLALCLLSAWWFISSERRSRAKCSSNLQKISKALVVSVMDSSEYYPEKWEQLFEWKYLKESDLEQFICPATGHKVGHTNDISEWSDYVLIPHLNSGTASVDAVLAYCPPKNHKDKGGYILFNDGSIEWYKKDDFLKIIRNQKR